MCSLIDHEEDQPVSVVLSDEETFQVLRCSIEINASGNFHGERYFEGFEACGLSKRPERLNLFASLKVSCPSSAKMSKFPIISSSSVEAMASFSVDTSRN